MPDITFPLAIKTARANVILNAIDAGAGDGTAKLYTGTPPANGGAITSQTLLGTLTCADPCGTVTDGVLTFTSLDATVAVADGTAGFLRFSDSTGSVVTDLVVGATGSGKPATMNVTAIVTGGPIDDISATWTEAG